MRPDKIWIWGTHIKPDPAKREAFRVMGRPYPEGGAQMHHDALDEAARRRLAWRRRVLPEASQVLQFGDTSLRRMSGGLVTRQRERNTSFEWVVLEDHGIGPGDGLGSTETLLFFGGDAVTLGNFSAHRHDFQRMREAIAPGGRVLLAHCHAFSDGGTLALEISRAIDRPVLGGLGEQRTHSFGMEGPLIQAWHGSMTLPTEPLPRWIRFFD